VLVKFKALTRETDQGLIGCSVHLWRPKLGVGLAQTFGTAQRLGGRGDAQHQSSECKPHNASKNELKGEH
jgi:hypothetical protein